MLGGAGVILRIRDVIAIVAIVAALGGSFLYGRHWEAQSQAAALDRLQARLEAADMRARDAARKLIEAERQAANLAATLEEQANEDPDANRRALGADSVRRIFNR